MTEGGAGEPDRKRFLIDELWFRRFVGAGLLAPYVRFVVRTNRRVFSPPDHLAAAAALEPAIYLTWHANLMAQIAAVHRTDHLFNMTSPHPDGRMAGALSEALGATTIVAEGGFGEKAAGGGVAGFRAMLRALKEGRSLYLTGEVPPQPGRQVAQGIVAVAKLSGRPIIPIGIAGTRQKIIERLWDKMQVNYPFGTMFIVSAPPIHIGKDEDAALGAARVKAALDAAYAEALEKAAVARTSRRR